MIIDNNEHIKKTTIKTYYSAVCTFDRQPFDGEITVEFEPKEHYVELIAFGKELYEITSCGLTTVEEICDKIHQTLLTRGITAKVIVSCDSKNHPSCVVEK